MTMRKVVKVELAGEERLLKYDYNAVCDLEERFGKGIAAIFTETQIGYNVVRLLYWAGLKWKIKGIQPAQVGQWLAVEIEEGRSLEDLLKPVMQALKAGKVLSSKSEDESEDEDEGNDQTPQP